MRIKGILRIDIITRHTKDIERTRPLGSFYYMVAAFIVIALCDKSVALASLVILAVSDPLSSIDNLSIPLVGSIVLTILSHLAA